MTDTTALAWAPQSCTLPTVERPLREAAFAALFREHLQRVRRPAPTVAELTLDADSLDRARELAALETSCCSFFSFDVRATDAGARMTITVGSRHAPVLDALVDAASAASATKAAG